MHHDPEYAGPSVEERLTAAGVRQNAVETAYAKAKLTRSLLEQITDLSDNFGGEISNEDDLAAAFDAVDTVLAGIDGGHG